MKIRISLLVLALTVLLRGIAGAQACPYSAGGLVFNATNQLTCSTAPTNNQVLQYNGSCIGGLTLGSFATANASTPPAIGSTTPAAGSFTNLSASGTVTGAGFSNYLASPPAIGGSSANSGKFTTLSASTAIAQSSGGTGASSYTGWPINIPHTETISGATNETLQAAWITTEVMTFSASVTVTLPVGTFAGQVLNGIVCQNGTGGFTPAFAGAGGLTIVGTFPTFTTTANKCGDFSLVYTTTTQAYLLGSAAGPL